VCVVLRVCVEGEEGGGGGAGRPPTPRACPAGRQCSTLSATGAIAASAELLCQPPLPPYFKPTGWPSSSCAS
jgi:hypothetical protein